MVFAFVNYRRNKIVTDSIVFFNILIFFIINQTHIVLYEDILHIPVIGNLTYHLLVVSFLLPTVGFFMVFKDRIIQKESSFFTAFDLIIILIIILLSITANLIPVSKSYLIADVIFRSFLIYAFYKVVISIQSSFRFYLFAGSFLFVILSQIIFLMH